MTTTRSWKKYKKQTKRKLKHRCSKAVPCPSKTAKVNDCFETTDYSGFFIVGVFVCGLFFGGLVGWVGVFNKMHYLSTTIKTSQQKQIHTKQPTCNKLAAPHIISLHAAASFPKHVHWANPEILLLWHSVEEGNKKHPWLIYFLQLHQLEQSYQTPMAKIYCIAWYFCNRRSSRKQHCSRTSTLGCPDPSSCVYALWWNISFFRQ